MIKKAAIAIAPSFVLLFPMLVGAEAFPNPLGATTGFDVLLQRILQAVVTIATPFIVLMIIFAGFQIVTAGGNEDKLSKGRQTLLWTLVGGLIVLGAQALATLIGNTVGSL